MAMMAMWCLICALFAAKAMENQISDSDEGASFAPRIITDPSNGDQEVSLAFTTWTWDKPESWRGEAMKVGSVGARQRWCFVDGWEFQAGNIFWMADDASPLGELNITLTCPDADKMMSRFRKVLEVRMPKTTNVWFQYCFIEKWFQDFPREKQYVCKFH